MQNQDVLWAIQLYCVRTCIYFTYMWKYKWDALHGYIVVEHAARSCELTESKNTTLMGSTPWLSHCHFVQSHGAPCDSSHYLTAGNAYWYRPCDGPDLATLCKYFNTSSQLTVTTYQQQVLIQALIVLIVIATDPRIFPPIRCHQLKVIELKWSSQLPFCLCDSLHRHWQSGWSEVWRQPMHEMLIFFNHTDYGCLYW